MSADAKKAAAQAGAGPVNSAALVPPFDLELRRLLNGDDIPEEDQAQCQAAWAALYDRIGKKNGTQNNTQFAEADRVEIYLHAALLAALGHESHSGWPFFSSLRSKAAPALKARALATKDLWVTFCAILPALSIGDVRGAVALYQQLGGHPVLTRLVLEWEEACLDEHDGSNKRATHEQFLSYIIDTSSEAA